MSPAAARDTGSGRPLLVKLGVKPGQRVAIVELAEPWFEAELAGAGAAVVNGAPGAGLDHVFYLVSMPPELDRLTELRSWIRQNGTIWVIREKGSARRVSDADVIAAGARHRLVDNKIASFSESLAAMRLVIRLAERTADR